MRYFTSAAGESSLNERVDRRRGGEQLHDRVASQNDEREDAQRGAVGKFKTTDSGNDHTKYSPLAVLNAPSGAKPGGSHGYRQDEEYQPHADENPSHKRRWRRLRRIGGGLRYARERCAHHDAHERVENAH